MLQARRAGDWEIEDVGGPPGAHTEDTEQDEAGRVFRRLYREYEADHEHDVPPGMRERNHCIKPGGEDGHAEGGNCGREPAQEGAHGA